MLGSCKSMKKAFQKDDVETAKTTELISIKEVVSTQDEVSAQDAVSAQDIVSTADVTVRTENVKPVDYSETEMLYGFYVIIGSFREIANARQQNIDLAAKGFSPVILVSENGLFRISVGGYNNENAARSQIARIRAEHAEHRDVWLLVRK